VSTIHELVCVEQSKVSSLEVQGTEFNIELSNIRKLQETHRLKLRGLEQLTARIEKESALKNVVELNQSILRSQCSGIES
jgi:hypothetical protein